jgi:magnesium transporter
MDSQHELTYAYLEAHPQDAARVLETMPVANAAALLDAIALRLSIPLVQQMLPFLSSQCLALLDDEKIIGILRGIGIQAGVAIVRQFDTAHRTKLLSELPTTLILPYDLLLGHQEDTVGAWMNPHILALKNDMHTEDALERIRDTSHAASNIIFVIDHLQMLTGYIELADLLRAERLSPLKKIMKPCQHKLPSQALLSGLLKHQGWYHSSLLPVIDRQNKLVGTISYEALQRALSIQIAAPTTQKHSDTTIASVTDAYWFSVSSLMQSVISLLPCKQSGIES